NPAVLVIPAGQSLLGQLRRDFALGVNARFVVGHGKPPLLRPPSRYSLMPRAVGKGGSRGILVPFPVQKFRVYLFVVRASARFRTIWSLTPTERFEGKRNEFRSTTARCRQKGRSFGRALESSCQPGWH